MPRPPSGASPGRVPWILLTLLPLAVLVACGDDGTGPDEAFDMHDVEFAPELGVDLSTMEHLGDQLYIKDLVATDSTIAEAEDTLFMLYTGWLPDGTVFDSNQDPDDPLDFVLGAGQLIPGWELGVVGMSVGGERLLVIPPDLAYGSSGAGGVIPPNSALVFEVELLRIGRPGSPDPGEQLSPEFGSW